MIESTQHWKLSWWKRNRLATSASSWQRKLLRYSFSAISIRRCCNVSKNSIQRWNSQHFTRNCFLQKELRSLANNSIVRFISDAMRLPATEPALAVEGRANAEKQRAEYNEKFNATGKCLRYMHLFVMILSVRGFRLDGFNVRHPLLVSRRFYNCRLCFSFQFQKL